MIGDLWSDICEEALKGQTCGERIDALTSTASGAVARSRLMAITHEVMVSHGDINEPIKEWRFRGNRGFQKGSIRYATCPGYSILMVTGEASEEAASRLVGEDCKWTRVDLAVDVEFPGAWPNLARSLWRAGEFKAAQEKRGRDCKLVEGLTGQTLYVGKRTSGRYFRLYDKSSHYGEEIGKIWRYEVELKKYQPERMRAWLFMEEGLARRIRQYVKKAFDDIGVPNFDETAGEMGLPRIALGCSSEESLVQWLRVSVRPPVQRLIQLGLLDSVVEALDLGPYVEARKEYL